MRWLSCLLLSFKAHAVGALLYLGISLVGAHKDLVQGAVIFLIAVIGALMNSAFDIVVRAAIAINFHDEYLQ